jgi:hypothetical protein
MCGHHHHRHHHHDDHTATTTTTTTVADRLPADDVRASDAEREEVVAALRTHAGEGRLTIDELDDRLGRVYGAQTRRDLVALTADLPRAPRRPRATRRDFAEHLRSYAGVMLLLVAIWALTGMGYFWPVWPAVGWGIALLSQGAAMGRRPPRRTSTAA